MGLVLGLGYLAKAIMFPVSFLFLAAALFSVRDIRLAIPRVLVAFFVFLLISVPYIAVVSASEGKYTISGSGTFAYAKHVNGVPFAHWQGETPGSGTPVHPSRKIFEAPPVYEFATPIGGTYPIGYDPSYWYEGLEIYFNLEQQLQALLNSFLFYFDVFAGLFGVILFGLILLYLMNRQPEWRPADVLSDWGLAFVSLAVFAFYAVVLVAGRYIGVFVVLFFANLLANLRLPDSKNSRRIATAISIIIIIFLLGNILVFTLSGYSDYSNAQNDQPSTNAQLGPPKWPGEVAEELNRLGIKAGDSVGVIGYAFDSYWARLARVQIVAELWEQDADTFWLGDLALQAEVIQAFAGSGAKAVVAEAVPAFADLGSWQQVGDTNYFIYIIQAGQSQIQNPGP